MRLPENWKKSIGAGLLLSATLAVAGCAPEASTSKPTTTPPIQGRTQKPTLPEQAGSTTGHGAEVPAPADAKEGEDKPE